MKSLFRWPVMAVALFALLLAGMPVFAETAAAPDAKAEVVATAQPAPAPVAAPVPVVVNVQAAPAPQAVISNATPAAPSSGFLSWLLALLQSPQALAAEIGAIIWVLKWLHDNKGLETDRWGGLVLHLYNDAEQLGAMNKWSGKQKCDAAIAQFADAFQKTFGKSPTSQDYQDLKNDLAKVAYDDDGITTLDATALAAPVAASAAVAPPKV